MCRFNLIKTILIFFLVSFLCTVCYARELTTFERVNSALANGEMTRGGAELEILRGLFAPEKVSSFLRGAPGHKRSVCATLALRGAIDALPLMDSAEREEALTYLLPRTAAALPALPNVYNTQHFSIQWGNDHPLTDIDGAVPAPDLNDNGDPDVIERWANYLEYSYEILNENYGFPVDVLSGRVRVVIANTSDLAIFSLPAFYFGITSPASPTPWLLLNNTFNWTGYAIQNDDPVNPYWGAMKVTGVHEFFHILQMLYVPPAWSVTHDDWWLEATSVWSEDKVFDEVNDYYNLWQNSSDQWIANPESGLQISRPYGDGVYERGLFSLYLDEHTGGPGSMTRVWDLIRGGKRVLYSNSSNSAVADGALDLFSIEKGFGGAGELYLGFASANAVMDYEEGVYYPRPNLRSISSISVAATNVFSPDYLGATYRREDGTAGPMRAVVSGTPADNWGMVGVIQRGTPSYSLCLSSKGTSGFASFQFDNAQSSDLVYAAPAYLEPAGISQSFSVDKPTPSPLQGAFPATLTSTDVSVSPVPRGIILSWPAPVTGGAVIKYKPSASGQWQTKTVMAPLNEAVIGDLGSEQSYLVEIWLYDGRGVEGSHFTFTALSGPALPPVGQAFKVTVDLETIGDQTIDENSELAFTLSMNNPDNAALTFTAAGLPDGASLNPSTGAFSWTPDFSQAGVYSITFTATDNETSLNSDSETMTITINNVNRAPVLASIGNKSISENTELAFTLTANDPDEDALIYSATGLPNGATLDASTGAFSWTPAISQTGTYDITFIVADNGTPLGLNDSETVTVTVGIVNRPPVLGTIGNHSVTVGTQLAFTVAATDQDGDPVAFSATGLPVGASFAGGDFSWIPNETQAGDFIITFTASDDSLVDSETITITVIPPSANGGGGGGGGGGGCFMQCLWR